MVENAVKRCTFRPDLSTRERVAKRTTKRGEARAGDSLRRVEEEC